MDVPEIIYLTCLVFRHRIRSEWRGYAFEEGPYGTERITQYEDEPDYKKPIRVTILNIILPRGGGL